MIYSPLPYAEVIAKHHCEIEGLKQALKDKTVNWSHYKNWFTAERGARLNYAQSLEVIVNLLDTAGVFRGITCLSRRVLVANPTPDQYNTLTTIIKLITGFPRCILR